MQSLETQTINAADFILDSLTDCAAGEAIAIIEIAEQALISGQHPSSGRASRVGKIVQGLPLGSALEAIRQVRKVIMPHIGGTKVSPLAVSPVRAAETTATPKPSTLTDVAVAYLLREF